MMVEHDMSVVFGLADRITVLVYGEVIASDTPAEHPRQHGGAGSLSRHGGGMMLEVRDLHAYYGKSHILQGVDLRVGEGEIVSLLGRNGVGRSTTCKAIMGLVPPVGADRVQGPADRRPAARPDRPCRRRLRARGPPGVSRPDGAAESRARAEARRCRRALEVRRHVRAVSQSRRAAATSRPACCRAASSRC